MRRVLSGLGWLVLLGVIGVRLWPQIAASLAWGEPGGEAPALRVQSLAGDSIDLAELRGQVVLVNFWATWCPPCRVEMPGFERVYRDRHADGFEVVGLSTDRGGIRPVLDFIARRELSFPNAMATGSSVREFGGIRVLPTSFLIDRQGRIRHQVRGIFTEPALRLAVDRLLREDPLALPSAGGDR